MPGRDRRSRTRWLAALASAAVSLAAWAGSSALAGDRDPGRLDRDFAGDGRYTDPATAGRNYAFSAAESVLPTGGGALLLGGGAALGDAAREPTLRPAVSRLRRNGSLDRSFGRGGRAVARRLSPRGTTQVAVQPRGRILLSAKTGKGADSRLAVAAFTRRGEVDRDFGRGGVAVVAAGRNATPIGLVVDARGRVVILGSVEADEAISIVRLLRDGSPDRRFGTAGVLRTAPFGDARPGYAVAIDRAGRILVAGGYDMSVARFRPGGRLDPRFGDGGVTTDVPSDGAPYSIALAPGGDIVLAGVGDNGDAGCDGDSRYEIVRYTGEGMPDRRFGRGGVRGVNFDSGCGAYAADVAVDDAGRSVVVGTTDSEIVNSGDFGVIRLTRSGRLDPSFSGDGRVTMSFGPGKSRRSDTALSVALTRDGRIAVAGYTNPRNSAAYIWAVARLLGG